MRIRPLRENEAPRVVELGKDSEYEERGLKDFNTRNLKRIIRNNKRTCWALEIEGKVEGCNIIMNDTCGRGIHWLLLLSGAHRRKGLGTKMFLHCNKKLKKLGFRKLLSDCERRNTASFKWAMKTGHRKIGTCKDYYAKGKDAVLFEYDL